MKTMLIVARKLILLVVESCLICFLPCSANRPDDSSYLRSAFDPSKTEWNIAWPGRVSQYDLVYLSPPVDPMQGIPLGNGDIGVLFWCEGSKLIAVVNKSDLWDDATFGPFRNWSPKEEDYNTTQRHACRIVIDFKLPVFNLLYLTDFKAKLNLADASFSLESTSVFGKVSLNSFVDHKTGVLFYDLNSDLTEDVPVEINIERFGSRTFSHWYSQINRDASIGLSGTEAGADSSHIYITQKLSTGTFVASGCVIHSEGLDVKYFREHSRCASIQLSGNRQKKAQLAYLVTSPGVGDQLIGTKETLDSVNEKGIKPFLKSNKEAWKHIWTRSFMDYGDDYLNNLWYLTMYYANASQGGNYPGRFNNGLWSWSSDVQNWNFYFHWNQQQLSWPLNAAGFHDLVNPYLNLRFNSLSKAKLDAKEIFNANGAFISDVTDRRGYNSSGENTNHTPVAEIALDFWRQYEYTCDKKFLKEKALPFIIEAARFFESLLVKENDGLYHARNGTGYEGWIGMKDGLTELVYARVLFTTALKALKVNNTHLQEEAKWEEILAHLAPLPVIKAGDALIVPEGSGYKLMKGAFKGVRSPADEIMAAGWGIKENKWMTVYFPVEDTVNFGLKLLDGIFPSVPSSPVFPSGLIGLAQKGSVLFDQMSATTLLYGSEITGWDPVPVVMARLGLKKELETDLQHFPGRWQIYCNGWGHWGLEGEVNKDAEWFFRTNMVRDVAFPDGERFPLPMWPFRHMSMESMSVLATAINESMLQSYNGTLRVFPAFSASKTGRFTLHSEGGFIVSSEIISGNVQWICIRSLYGNPFRLELPWSSAVMKSSMKSRNQRLTDSLAEIKTKPDEIIMIFREGVEPDHWSVIYEEPLANEKVRYHSSGKAKLGIPRMF
jgi:alpha-L-fucosidase 2